MTAITTLFWDIGGVILTNGWDTAARQKAAARFEFDGEDYESRHDQAFPLYEIGQLTLDEYLERTLFFRPRAFDRRQFREFMLAQSQEMPDSRAVLRGCAGTGRYLVAAINNEPRELNDHRITHFGLRADFRAFFSSCYVGARKPEPTIYRIALDVTQRTPEECVFIDDRAANLPPAAGLGMRTIHFRSAVQLRQELQRFGIGP